MTNIKKISSPTRLEQLLEHYQQKVFVSPAEAGMSLEERIELFARERARHPGLHLAHDLWLRIVSLKYFLDLAETCMATPKRLTRMAALVDACYFKESDGVLHNASLEIKGEIEVPNFSSPESYKVYAKEYSPETETLIEEFIDKEAIEDLKRYMPTASMEGIRKARKEIKILEAKQGGILSSAAMLADGCLDGDKRADMERRLLRFWSGFKKNYAELLENDSFGDFEFTLEKIKKSLAGEESSYLGAFPAKIYRRYMDYFKGTKGRDHLKHKDRGHESLDGVDEKIIFKHMKDDNEFKTNSEDEIMLKSLLHEIDKLPAAEQHAMKKTLRGETLTSAERKSKERAISRLKKTVSK
jgi:hypothetical protein